MQVVKKTKENVYFPILQPSKIKHNVAFKKICFKMKKWGVPTIAQQKRIPLGTMRLQVRPLALLSRLRIWHCSELWCRLQTQFGSCVAVDGSCSSNLTPSLGIAICRRCSPKKRPNKTKQNKTKPTKNIILVHLELREADLLLLGLRRLHPETHVSLNAALIPSNVRHPEV